MIPNHYGYAHPGEKPWEAEGVAENHVLHEISDKALEGYMRRGGLGGFGFRVNEWGEPSPTIFGRIFNEGKAFVHPGPNEGRTGEMFYNVIPQRPDNGLTIVELFAGGGLMASGLKAAGYNIIWANDFDKSACAAYRHNHGEHIIQGDITTIDVDSIPNADIFAGGPPCQDFSVAGTGAGEDGERGKLVWTYLSIIEKKQPKAFIFENVKGLVGKQHRHTFDAILQRFNEIGYKVSHQIVNAWDHGVAQKRERVFIVGIRADLNLSFSFPDPLPADHRTQVLRDVIGDLPEPDSRSFTKQNGHDNPSLMHEPAKTIIASSTGGKNAFYPDNHDPKELSDKGIAYLYRNDGRSLKKHRPPTMDEPSQTLVGNLAKGVPYGLHYPENHDPQELSDKAIEYMERNWEHRGSRVKNMDEPSATVSAVYAKGVPYGVFFPDKPPENHDGHLFNNVGNNPTWEHANREANLDAPAPTRTEKDRCDGINTINGRPRRFTVRECLRIQSVPDWYVFPESISLSAQYRIVGNGVASRVAYLLGISLEEQLKGATTRRRVSYHRPREEGQIDLFEVLHDISG